MKTIINIYGPCASGKTFNKEALKELFQCDCVYDGEWEDSQIQKAEGRVLVLSNFEDIYPPNTPKRFKKVKSSMNVPIEEAKLLLKKYEEI